MKRVYLHNEMKDILEHNGRTLTTRQLAQKVNERRIYQKRDNSAILHDQIYARARVERYRHMFIVEDGMISLKY